MQKRQEAEHAAATAVDHSGEETPEEEGVDEPTREFMPISRERVSVASRNIEPPVSLFSEEEEEEEPEEEAIEPPISRRAQRRAEKARRLAEEEEDDYDEDDEDTTTYEKIPDAPTEE